MHVGGIFCDWAKASDCMNDETLLAKLHFYGIWGVSKDWFRPCLTNRRQNVAVKPPNTAENIFCHWGTLKQEFPKD